MPYLDSRPLFLLIVQKIYIIHKKYGNTIFKNCVLGMPTKLDDSTRCACLAGITMRATCSVGPFREALMAPYIQARPLPVDTCN